jgi:hypothetical protein
MYLVLSGHQLATATVSYNVQFFQGTCNVALCQHDGLCTISNTCSCQPGWKGRSAAAVARSICFVSRCQGRRAELPSARRPARTADRAPRPTSAAALEVGRALTVQPLPARRRAETAGAARVPTRAPVRPVGLAQRARRLCAARLANTAVRARHPTSVPAPAVGLAPRAAPLSAARPARMAAAARVQTRVPVLLAGRGLPARRLFAIQLARAGCVLHLTSVSARMATRFVCFVGFDPFRNICGLTEFVVFICVFSRAPTATSPFAAVTAQTAGGARPQMCAPAPATGKDPRVINLFVVAAAMEESAWLHIAVAASLLTLAQVSLSMLVVKGYHPGFLSECDVDSCGYRLPGQEPECCRISTANVNQ